MSIEEIIRYVNYGKTRSVCVYREYLIDYPSIIKSIYILKGDADKFCISVEFDPYDLVDHGEGWIWQSEGAEIGLIISIIEGYIGSDLKNWENHTKSGRLLDIEDIEVNVSDTQDVFAKKVESNEVHLPGNIKWVKAPFL